MNQSLALDGGLTVRLALGEGVIQRVTISSARMTRVSRLFAGRAVEDVLARIPLVFSLCGTAQTAAAVAAAEAALALPPHPLRVAARRALVAVETAQEHLWRVLLDWPIYLGEQPATATVATVRRILPTLRAALDAEGNLFACDDSPEPVSLTPVHAAARSLGECLTQAVFGMPPGAWLALDAAGFAAWWRQSRSLAARVIAWITHAGHAATGRIEAVFLPELEPGRLVWILRKNDAEAFAARPTWSGGPCETTPLSRQHGHPLVAITAATHGYGLLARLLARLVELARVPAQLRELMLTAQRDQAVPAQCLPPGCGLAQLEAARGRLIHFVEAENRRVRRYQIVAPTEWNFHPGGVVVRGLTGLPAARPEAAVTAAERFIHAVDPCVRCTIEAQGAPDYARDGIV